MGGDLGNMTIAADPHSLYEWFHSGQPLGH